jgi:hypothetical protein
VLFNCFAVKRAWRLVCIALVYLYCLNLKPFKLVLDCPDLKIECLDHAVKQDSLRV